MINTLIFQEILEDFGVGIFNSVKINSLFKITMENIKIQRLIYKICMYNFLLHFLPTIIFNALEIITGISFVTFLNIINYPIGVFSALFHLFHYIELIDNVSNYMPKTSNTINAIDSITLAITMSIYQIIIYLTTTFINFIMHDRLYFLAIFLNFFILTIYHSFYCFNNLWQYRKIDMIYRIDMYEKLWPYYTGYGFFSTILYLYSNNMFVLGTYNIYIAILISLPFLLDRKYPTEKMPYPKINLIIFSNIIGYLFKIIKNWTNYLI